MYAADTTPKRYAPDATADRVSARLDQVCARLDRARRFDEQHRAADVALPAEVARLRRLEAALDEEQCERRRRAARVEEEVLSMRRPLTTERAYRYFGLLLGALPPAAIMLRILAAEVSRRSPLYESDWQLIYATLFFGLVINLTCALVGQVRGAKVARRIERAERGTWAKTLLAALLSGVAWAVVTGGFGGAMFVLIGAVFGVVCALPVALVGFPVFTVCHRLLARGGMIDARHFWPVACGVAALLAALILSPGLLPY
jgi:hypothetical protein